MYSIHHAAVSAVVGAIVAFVAGSIDLLGVALPPIALVGYAVAIGVFVDLDHFLIARLRTGSWEALRFCLRNPLAAFGDQGEIFAPGDVGGLNRLLSHLLIAGVAVAGLAALSVEFAVFTGAVLYVHVVTDVAWDIRILRRYEGAIEPRVIGR